MNSSCTIDASVIVSAFSPAEAAHPASKAFLTRVRDEAAPMILPTLVLPELASAIARGQGKPDLGIAFAEELSHFPNLVLVDLDESLAKLAVEVAAQYRLRGSDAVYAAVALRFGTRLVTLDREQLDRLEGVLPVGAP
ncbi:MAG: type II toxin-antitoxin system VapC family toxin [Chloroflexota bacterium]